MSWVWLVVRSICGAATMLWILAALAMSYGWRVPIVRFFYHELKPFFLPAVVIAHVLDVAARGDPFDPWRLFGLVWNLITWLALRNNDDDDDRWKRRRRKLTERIQRQGARLVAVPQQGTS